ncbi:ubiquitin carboxyl-terminal hydrolase-domain-containing protein [Lipomyces kononenkoae]|uniref:Ubiquitin carboxyl-terminal hydrolase-domain-containing protein n=1 Tax=Lipomyces kononenkoae TaxID=34357 RepID=A0ACC3SV95_LIPKO
MLKLKRGRRRIDAKSVGLDYYKQNPSPTRSSELDVASAKVVRDKLAKDGFQVTVDDAKLVLRSRYASGQIDKAVELYKFYQEANEGILLDVQDAPLPSLYSVVSWPEATDSMTTASTATSFTLSSLSPSRAMDKIAPTMLPMLGAENLNYVTCYLDSLLFAMYARLESFEPILYKVYDDGPLRRLSTLIRMWVNMLRAGKLITTDVMDQLRIALDENGWTDAGLDHQQDASEAFVFITEKLAMPLLTLKMDIAHGGKPAADDDHKFVNERLLHVPILDGPPEVPVSLEACLEEYFSNSVVVRREIERHQSISIPSPTKVHVAHVESTEVESLQSRERSGTIDMRPEVLHRSLERDNETVKQASRARDIVSAFRNYSLNAPESAVSLASSTGEPSTTGIRPEPHRRRSSLRTPKNEISLPAWAFLKLLPFYADAPPQSSSTEHFALKRPVLPICLKRYSWSTTAKAVRNDRKVLIPEVIELPQFVADDHCEGDALYGNFRLVLEAAVCHRGNSVNSGHYISLVRDSVFRRRQELMKQQWDTSLSDGGYDDASSATSATLAGDNWLLFDDLASPRISSTTFRDAMAKEMPYMLFYRMMHIDEPIQLEPLISSESALSSRLDDKLSPSSTSTSMVSTRSVPTMLTGSSEEDGDDEDEEDEDNDDDKLDNGQVGNHLGDLSDKLSTEDGRQPRLGERTSSSSLSPRKLHKLWRERSVSSKWSSASVPEADNSTNNASEHHQHRRYHTIHRRHHKSKSKSKDGITGKNGEYEEEDRCVVV